MGTCFPEWRNFGNNDTYWNIIEEVGNIGKSHGKQSNILFYKGKEECKIQELIQTSTALYPGHDMGKRHKQIKT